MCDKKKKATAVSQRLDDLLRGKIETLKGKNGLLYISFMSYCDREAQDQFKRAFPFNFSSAVLVPPPMYTGQW